MDWPSLRWASNLSKSTLSEENAPIEPHLPCILRQILRSAEEDIEIVFSNAINSAYSPRLVFFWKNLVKTLIFNVNTSRMKYDWEDFFIELVSERFEELKSKNARLSVRSYANMARLSPGAMSLILKKSISWSLSIERALEVLNNIKVSQDKINHFSIKVSPRLIDDSTKLTHQDEHVFLSNPYYMPICLAYSLSTEPKFSHIAKTLNISPLQVRVIVEDLLEKGFLEKKDSRIIQVQNKRFITSDGPPKEVIRNYHLQSLDSFKEIIINGNTEERDVTGLLLSGSSEQINLVKDEIRQFYQRIHAIMNAPQDKDDVFRVFVGFAPMKLGPK